MMNAVGSMVVAAVGPGGSMMFFYDIDSALDQLANEVLPLSNSKIVFCPDDSMH